MSKLISTTDPITCDAGSQLSRRALLPRLFGAAALAALAPAASSIVLGDEGEARRHQQNIKPNDKGVRKVLQSIQAHENDHVAFLVMALGNAARPKPTFQGLDSRNYRTFIQMTMAFENTGVGAYLGAAPILNSAAYLAAAGSIMTVEARHSGWVNVYLGTPITLEDASFEIPLTDAQVAAAVAPFVADLNGGPPLAYSQTPSDENDIAILNFALALEFLEAEFYNINVPKYVRSR